MFAQIPTRFFFPSPSGAVTSGGDPDSEEPVKEINDPATKLYDIMPGEPVYAGAGDTDDGLFVFRNYNTEKRQDENGKTKLVDIPSDVFRMGYDFSPVIIVRFQKGSRTYPLGYEDSVAVLYPQYDYDINGYMYWKSDPVSGVLNPETDKETPFRTTLCIYNAEGSSYEPKWVLAATDAPGYIPREYDFLGINKEYGDIFFSGNIPDGKERVKWQLRGHARLADPTEVDYPLIAVRFPCWEHRIEFGAEDAEAGKYLPSDDMLAMISEEWRNQWLYHHRVMFDVRLPRYLGSPFWLDGQEQRYVRSISRDGSGKYTYGRVRFSNGRWLIGAYGNAGGWWEGEEPQIGGNTIFRFRVPDNSEAEIQPDIVLQHGGFFACTGNQDCYLAEFPIWR